MWGFSPNKKKERERERESKSELPRSGAPKITEDEPKQKRWKPNDILEQRLRARVWGELRACPLLSSALVSSGGVALVGHSSTDSKEDLQLPSSIRVEVTFARVSKRIKRLIQLAKEVPITLITAN